MAGNGKQSVGRICEEDMPSSSSAGVYSSTTKTIQEKRKKAEMDVHKKYEEFLKRENKKAVEIIDVNNDLEESTTVDCQRAPTTSTDMISPGDPSVICLSGSLKRDVQLNERLRKVEQFTKTLRQNKELVQVDDDELNAMDPSDFCPDMNIKVYHKGIVLRHRMSVNEKFSTLKKWLVKETGEKLDNVSILFKDVALKDDETPASVGLSILDILDFIPMVFNSTTNQKVENQMVKLIFRTERFREKFELSVCTNDKLSKVLPICADKIQRHVGNLQFVFDGEILNVDSTVEELELEEGFQIDLVEKH